MLNDPLAEGRADYIAELHRANNHAKGPGCHCREAGARPDRGSGCHALGTCITCDVWRTSPQGQAEKAYWAL